MPRGKGRKRTRRTRQQLLEAENLRLNKPHASSLVFEADPIILPTLNPAEASSSNISNNQKKSLRIKFQEAKNGKLGAGSRRQSRIKTYKWPRTVEAANSPFTDATGKNKMFFVLAIGLYPENKIVQPSDSESDEEENMDPEAINNVENGVDGDLHHSDFFSDPDSGYLGSLIAGENAEGGEIGGANLAFAGIEVPIPALNIDAEDPDELFIHERSPSPVSPKIRRGRRPQNARRVPYGRAADIDHSWRSNCNRRNVQRRGAKQARNRINDPQLIQDVINTVVQRHTQGMNVVPSPCSSISAIVSDEETVNQDQDMENNNNCYSAESVHKNNKNSFIDARKLIIRTPSPDMIQENIQFIKHEIATPESSDPEEDVEVDVEDCNDHEYSNTLNFGAFNEDYEDVSCEEDETITNDDVQQVAVDDPDFAGCWRTSSPLDEVEEGELESDDDDEEDEVEIDDI